MDSNDYYDIIEVIKHYTPFWRYYLWRDRPLKTKEEICEYLKQFQCRNKICHGSGPLESFNNDQTNEFFRLYDECYGDDGHVKYEYSEETKYEPKIDLIEDQKNEMMQLYICAMVIYPELKSFLDANDDDIVKNRINDKLWKRFHVIDHKALEIDRKRIADIFRANEKRDKKIDIINQSVTSEIVDTKWGGWDKVDDESKPALDDESKPALDEGVLEIEDECVLEIEDEGVLKIEDDKIKSDRKSREDDAQKSKLIWQEGLCIYKVFGSDEIVDLIKYIQNVKNTDGETISILKKMEKLEYGSCCERKNGTIDRFFKILLNVPIEKRRIVAQYLHDANYSSLFVMTEMAKYFATLTIDEMSMRFSRAKKIWPDIHISRSHRFEKFFINLLKIDEVPTEDEIVLMALKDINSNQTIDFCYWGYRDDGNEREFINDETCARLNLTQYI